MKCTSNKMMSYSKTETKLFQVMNIKETVTFQGCGNKLVMFWKFGNMNMFYNFIA